jgi:hypothetical protein
MFDLRKPFSSMLLGAALTGGVFATCIAPSSAFAQAVSGEITGTVTDAAGAVVPNATLIATNTATGVTYNASSNSVGEYRVPNLPAGTYDITVTAQGFTKYLLKGFLVELNKVSTANVALKVSSSETVEVSADAGVALDTTTAQLGISFDSRAITDLPAATFNVLNLSLLSSGVASSGGVGAGSGPTIGGQRPRDNNFTVEGIDNNSKSVTGPLIYIPNDAVGEFTVLQNQFGAQYGHSNAGQFNQTVKSGTNKIHGAAYEYFQNRNLNAIDAGYARSQFDAVTNPNPKAARYDDNRFGGQVGGPILKNKLFLFSNYEQEPVGAPGTTASFCAPTADGFTTLNGVSGLSATNLAQYVKYSPVASVQAASGDRCPSSIIVGGTTIPVGDVGVSAGSYTNNYRSTSSMDWSIGSKDNLRVRYIYNRSDGLDAAAEFSSFWAPAPNRYHLATFSEFHTFSPTLTNEFRVGFNRYYSVISAPGEFPGLAAFPNIVVDDLNGVDIGPDDNAPQGTIQNTYQASDSILWTKGKHSFNIGYEYRDVISPQAFVQRARGDYEYKTLDVFLRDLSPDTFGERNATAPGVSSTYYGNQNSSYAYVNDDWRISQKLTINLGVRYEFTSVPLGQQQQKANSAASVPGLITFGAPKSQKANFVPRVGFAYSLDSKTVVRGGFGMGYDVLYDNLGILSSAPQYQITEDVDTGTSTAGFLAGGGLPATVAIPDLATQRALTTAYIPNQKLPYAENWSLGVERTFGKDYTVELRYVGTRGIHLPTQLRLNRQSQATNSNSLPTFFTPTPITSTDALTLTQLKANRPSFVPAYTAAGFQSSIVSFQPSAESNYNGLALQVTRRMSHGLQIIGAYTWSKTMDDATADVFSTYLTPRRAQDFQNISGDYSRSALDHTHRLTAAVIYDLPFFAHSNFLKRNLLGNWEIAPVYTYQSPEYATVQSNVDSNLNGDAAGDRAFVNPKGKKGTGSGVNGIYDPALAGNCDEGDDGQCNANLVGYYAIDPNAQYVVAGSGTLPTAGRNTLPIRPIDNFDVTAIKRLSFGERIKFEFQAQAFNVLNHSQYLPGSLNNINSLGYTDGGTHSFLTPDQPTFNNPSATFNNNARAMQLVVKIIF